MRKTSAHQQLPCNLDQYFSKTDKIENRLESTFVG